METMHYFLSLVLYSLTSCEFLFIAKHYHTHNAGAEDFPLVAPPAFSILMLEARKFDQEKIRPK